MLPRAAEEPSEIHHLRSVEMQRHDGGASGGAHAHEKGEVVTPGEVIPPALMARMVKRNHLAARRIAPRDLIVLVIIAALTREREVVGRRRSTADPGDDVLHRERLAGDARGAPTVFAKVSGTLLDLPPQRRRNAPFIPRRARGSPGYPSPPSERRHAGAKACPDARRAVRRGPRPRPSSAAARRTLPT